VGLEGSVVCTGVCVVVLVGLLAWKGRPASEAA